MMVDSSRFENEVCNEHFLVDFVLDADGCNPINDKFPYEEESYVTFSVKTYFEAQDWFNKCYFVRDEYSGDWWIDWNQFKENEDIPYFKIDTLSHFDAHFVVDYECDDPIDIHTNDLNEFLSKFNIQKNDFYEQMNEFLNWYLVKDMIDGGADIRLDEYEDMARADYYY